MQETTDVEESIDSPGSVPVWSTAGIQADSKGDEVNDKGVYELEQKQLQDLTNSGVSLILS